MKNLLDSMKKLLKNRSLKYGTNAIILTAVVIAIAVVLNVFVGMLDLKTDLTANKLYSIGDVSKKILNEMKKDVTIYGLFDEKKNTDYKEVVDLLNIYAKYPHIKVQYVDPDKNPSFIKQMDPDNVKNLQSNDFIVKCGNKMKILTYSDLFEQNYNQQTYQMETTGSNAELGLTGAIKYVTADVTPVVYFIEGHDELKADSELTSVKNFMERNNYEVKSLNLVTAASVPNDAAMILIAAPKRDLTSDEKDKLQAYLKAGGKGIFMFDTIANDPGFPQFESVFADYNIGIDSDKIKETDENRHVPNSPYSIVVDVSGNSIISQAFNILLMDSRSVKKLKNDKDYITVTSLMSTSDKAIGEQTSKSNGEDIKGPLDIAIASENNGGAKTSKIIVMGNASFISDNAQNTYGSYYQYGAQFFIQSVSWMQDKKDDLMIQPKSYSTPTLTITSQQASVIGLSLIIGLPVLILAAGLAVFLRRRHL